MLFPREPRKKEEAREVDDMSMRRTFANSFDSNRSNRFSGVKFDGMQGRMEFTSGILIHHNHHSLSPRAATQASRKTVCRVKANQMLHPGGRQLFMWLRAMNLALVNEKVPKKNEQKVQQHKRNGQMGGFLAGLFWVCNGKFEEIFFWHHANLKS